MKPKREQFYQFSDDYMERWNRLQAMRPFTNAESAFHAACGMFPELAPKDVIHLMMMFSLFTYQES